jgi:hypothetical protein
MVTRTELRKNIRIKIMLRGGPGTGKTYAAVKTAAFVSNKGGNVLYLDHEGGADRELDNLSDKELENIYPVGFSDLKELTTNLDKYRKELGEKLRLVVIDPMPLIELARLTAKKAFLQQGYYHVGEGIKNIENRETFDLRGYMYQIPNTWTTEFLTEIATSAQDIICTLTTATWKSKKEGEKKEEAYDGKFDFVYATDVFLNPNNKKNLYGAKAKKERGMETTSDIINNVHTRMIELFKKKYETPTVSISTISQNKV